MILVLFIILFALIGYLSIHTTIICIIHVGIDSLEVRHDVIKLNFVGNLGLLCSHALDHVGCMQICPKLFKSLATDKQVLKNSMDTIENIGVENKAKYLLSRCS